MLATYRGFYRYDKELLQKATGFARTYFTIDINETKENTLTGTVEDDIHTGGMQGIGIITGEIQGNSISFTKQMPKTMYMTVGTDGNSQRKELDRKHPLIYYTGTEIEKGKYAGTWKIKSHFLIHMLTLLLGIKTTGTWEMTKYE